MIHNILVVIYLLAMWIATFFVGYENTKEIKK